LNRHIKILKSLIEKTGHSFVSASSLPRSGSSRQYFRLVVDSGKKSFVGVYNSDLKENITHYSFTQHFINKGLPVPTIYATSDDYCYFILDDIGDESLFAHLEKNKNKLSNIAIERLFEKAIDDLLRFQIDGIQGLDLEKAYPIAFFNRRSVLWDLNYFKYFFIKTNELTFDENQLENDFHNIVKRIMQADMRYFNYRDFQSRNIMLHRNSYYYIDFQGGRKGPLQYDLVSLVYQAKANLNQTQRKHLLCYYLNQLEKKLPRAVAGFEKYYTDFIYLRLMQVLGAYGYRGLFQRKPHFLQSIYPAISNLETLLEEKQFSVKLPELENIFKQILALKNKFYIAESVDNKLTVNINSFSYKITGIPYDISPNGGGFVFDCRALPNPGRLPGLCNYSGKDRSVINYLEEHKEIAQFKDNVFNIVDQSITNYLERKFSRLQVNFGCTGGRHRSVYMAEQLKKHLQNTNRLNVVLQHLEQEIK